MGDGSWPHGGVIGRADDAAAEAEYEKQRAAMQDSVDKTTATMTATLQELADKKAQIQSEETAKSETGADLANEEELKTALYSDCSLADTR